MVESSKETIIVASVSILTKLILALIWYVNTIIDPFFWF